MKLLTKPYFIADKTNAAVADITDIYPPVKGDNVIYVSRQHGQGPETAPTEPDNRLGQPNRYWPLLADMPTLVHWPDRSKPFDYADSQVIAYVRERFGISMDLAIRVFDYARYKKVVVFNSVTKLWCGTKGGEP